jgi:hypothetical protein
MVILKVNQPGHVIHLQGLKSVRSPVSIDVTDIDMNYLQTELRKQGLKGYEIKYSLQEQKHNLPTYTEKITIIDTTPKLEEMDYKLNTIESLVRELIDRKSEVHIIEKEGVGKEEVHTEKEISFVPTIDFSVSLSKELDTVEVEKEEISGENLHRIPKGFFKKINKLD